MDTELPRFEEGRLASLVQALDPGARLIRYWPLTGGVSAQTTALEIERANAGKRKLVLRAHGSRDVARDPDIAQHEFQLLEALSNAGLPVPRPVHVVDAGGASLACQAVVVEFVEGEIAPSPASLTGYVAEMARWLAQIHAFDLASHDLGFLVSNEYQAAHLFETRPDDSDLVRSICQTVARVGPTELRNDPVLLHGDFWQGNLLWRDGRIVAILDWEDAMIGDPIIDLARSRLELHWMHGELARERFTSHYLSWNDIDVDSLPFWDLAMALRLSRDLPGWRLPPEREQEMMSALEQFVEQATEQLAP